MLKFGITSQTMRMISTSTKQIQSNVNEPEAKNASSIEVGPDL